MYCLACPYSHFAIDKIKDHVLSQHPSGVTIVTNNSRQSSVNLNEVTFFCVKDSCSHFTSKYDVFENHLLSCCSLRHELSELETKRLKLSIQYILEFEKIHFLTTFSKFLSFASSILDSRSSVDVCVKSLYHNLKQIRKVNRSNYQATTTSTTSCKVNQFPSGISAISGNESGNSEMHYSQILTLANTQRSQIHERPEGKELQSNQDVPGVGDEVEYIVLESSSTPQDGLMYQILETQRLGQDLEQIPDSYTLVDGEEMIHEEEPNGSSSYNPSPQSDRRTVLVVQESDVRVAPTESLSVPSPESQYWTEVKNACEHSTNEVNSNEKHLCQLCSMTFCDGRSLKFHMEKEHSAECVRKRAEKSVDNMQKQNGDDEETEECLSVQCSPHNQNLLRMSIVDKNSKKGTGESSVICLQNPKDTGESSIIGLQSHKDTSESSGIRSRLENHSETQISSVRLHNSSEVQTSSGSPQSHSQTSFDIDFLQDLTEPKHALSDLRLQKQVVTPASSDNSPQNQADKPFKCSYCTETFCQMPSLISHIKCHTRGNVFVCFKCGGFFKGERDFHKHSQTHGLDERDFHKHSQKYGWDERDFHKRSQTHGLDERDFHKHSQTHGLGKRDALTKKSTPAPVSHENFEDMRFKCSYCPLHFSEISVLVNHIRVHMSGKLFECFKCDKLFNSEQDLDVHNTREHVPGRLKCSFCSECLDNIDSFNKHIKTHSGENTFQQPVTGSSQRSNDLVDIQIYQEAGAEGPVFKYKVCKQQVTHEGNWENHQKAHAEDTFKCSACHESFIKTSDLLNHLKTHLEKGLESDKTGNVLILRQAGETRTEELPPIKCSVCDEENCRCRPPCHTATEKQIKCNLCGVTCPQQETIARHMWEKHGWGQLLENLECTDIAVSHEKSFRFKCDMCSKMFHDAFELEEHKEIHALVKPFECHKCGKSFNSRNILRNHQIKHGLIEPDLYRRVIDSLGERLKNQDEVQFKCHLCGATYSQQESLATHAREKHGVKQLVSLKKSFVCEICSHSFMDGFELEEHKETHASEKPYKCLKCDESFSSRYNCRNHQRKHQRKQRLKIGPDLYKNVRDFLGKWSCYVCPKTFQKQKDLFSHLKKHFGEKPYKCPECGKLYCKRNALIVHLRWHSGERPFLCTICGKRFIRIETLKEHTKIHTGEKPYKCDECPRSFINQSVRKAHKRWHSGERPFLCAICGLTFRSQPHFSEHKRIHTGIRKHKCDVCGKSFFTNNCLRKHNKRTHLRKQAKLCGAILEKKP